MTYSIREIQKLSGKTAWSTESKGVFQCNIHKQDDFGSQIYASQDFNSWNMAEKWAKKICAA